MGWLGIPLGVATTMFAGMTLGIGIDFAIHLIHRYRLATSGGLAGTDAWSDALHATGPAILISSLAVALGFGVLLLSQVPANARLAGVTIVCVVSCLVATLFLLPAVSPGAGAKRRGRP
jgi:predicted RND superfamily exporter protein